MTLGTKLRTIRKERSISQKSLAEKAGIANSTLCDIENDRSNPSLKALEKITAALDVPISSIFLDTNSDGIVKAEKAS
jgi:transcriptional regulator with XRE-family HTH domain